MKTKTAVIIVIIAAVLGGIYLWQFGTPEESPPRDTNGEPRAELREPDSETPAAPVCAFQEGTTVTFELHEGIPAPRCARVLPGQMLAFTNRTDEPISFTFLDHAVRLEPGETKSIDVRAEDYLEPGVHVLAMDFYGGSGPEAWVQHSRVFQLSGTVRQQFVSARAIVLETPGGEVSLAITTDTRIFNAQGAPISPGDFSRILTPGSRVTAIAELPEANTGTALEIRVESGASSGGPVPPPGGTACTLEAKICPDGSYVGRTGPNCEFAPCPGE